MASRGKNAGGLKASFQICDTVIDVLKNDKAIYSIISQCERIHLHGRNIRSTEGVKVIAE